MATTTGWSTAPARPVPGGYNGPLWTIDRGCRMPFHPIPGHGFGIGETLRATLTQLEHQAPEDAPGRRAASLDRVSAITTVVSEAKPGVLPGRRRQQAVDYSGAFRVFFGLEERHPHRSWPYDELYVDKAAGLVCWLKYNGVDADDWSRNNFPGFVAARYPLTDARPHAHRGAARRVRPARGQLIS